MLKKVGTVYVESAGIMALVIDRDYKEVPTGTEVVYDKSRVSVEGMTPQEVHACLFPEGGEA